MCAQYADNCLFYSLEAVFEAAGVALPAKVAAKAEEEDRAATWRSELRAAVARAIRAMEDKMAGSGASSDDLDALAEHTDVLHNLAEMQLVLTDALAYVATLY